MDLITWYGLRMDVLVIVFIWMESVGDEPCLRHFFVKHEIDLIEFVPEGVFDGVVHEVLRG